MIYADKYTFNTMDGETLVLKDNDKTYRIAVLYDKNERIETFYDLTARQIYTLLRNLRKYDNCRLVYIIDNNK